MSEEPKIYSVALRLPRITHEDAYVLVPITNAITKPKEDGTLAIDFEAFAAEAIRISKEHRVEWKTETCHTEPHPIQDRRLKIEWALIRFT